MATMKEEILALVGPTPGLTDREITDRILGSDVGQQAVNQAARALAASGRVTRRPRQDGRIGNYPTALPNPDSDLGTDEVPPPNVDQRDQLSEDDVKRKLQTWLEASGWRVSVTWGRGHGIDIEAERNGMRWVIEAKGCGSRDATRVNYFLAILGELLQRMGDPNARYSIAVPDMQQFRGLWRRLPQLAKSRTGVSALFVAASGHVEEVP